MTAALKSIAETVEQLPAKERVYLAERLLASLDEADLDHEWADEAVRRRDEVRSGKVKAGQTVLLEGVGGGFTWGAVLLNM